jgi:DNA-binding XRE family transcriptional regulator
MLEASLAGNCLTDGQLFTAAYDVAIECAAMSTKKAFEAERAQILQEFGDRVRELRELKSQQLGLRYGQQAVADAARLHRTEISDIECGKTEPRLLTLMCLADGFGLTLNDLVEGVAVPRERKPPPWYRGD